MRQKQSNMITFDIITLEYVDHPYHVLHYYIDNPLSYVHIMTLLRWSSIAIILLHWPSRDNETAFIKQILTEINSEHRELVRDINF